MSNRDLIPKGQIKLLDAVEAISVAYLMSSDDPEENNDISISVHSEAIDGSPGYNIFFKNMRFELGYQNSKVKFSLPPTEKELEKFKFFLEDSLEIKKYEIFPRVGIKYIVEIELEDYIYSDEGIDKITQLTNKVLEYL
ncbi:gp519 [Bacillus phage G]|uniref:Gp519 n=1 Tax=Bacillus phage G TaxID=2884420 RepID=G3MAR0_9CAUD|nr:gp519 [Bacillus phage G]AEO93777.1 gp519 [Bacillus phage G]